MKNNTIILVVIALVIILGGAAIWQYQSKTTVTTADGVVWINSSDNDIKFDLLQPKNTVLAKFTVTGEARGPWFFEASFPVEVLDKDGNRLAMEPATADGEWMTEEFVRFSVTLDVGTYAGPATVVFHKQNASGEAERDASVSYPIEIFATN